MVGIIVFLLIQAICSSVINYCFIFSSSLIEKILVDAVVNSDKVFSVVVVAANPWNEGREMLRRLTEKNINCSLVMISALSFVMRKVCNISEVLVFL